MKLRDLLKKAFKEAGVALPTGQPTKTANSGKKTENHRAKRSGSNKPSVTTKSRSKLANKPKKSPLPRVSKVSPPAPPKQQGASTYDTPYILKISNTAKPLWNRLDNGENCELLLFPINGHQLQAHTDNINGTTDEHELMLGLDFGTATVKVVIGDKLLDKAFAVPFQNKLGVDQYLLPTRIYQDMNTFSLLPGGTSLDNLKLELLNNPDDAETRIRVTAFLALVIRHARAWLFTEYRSVYNSMNILWSMALGLPSRDQDEKAELYSQIGSTAWLLAGSETEDITYEDVEEALARAKAISAGEHISHKSDFELSVVPEIAAQVYGYVASDSFDPQALNVFLMADIGAGTVDAAVFRVHKDKGRNDYNFYTTTVEPLGVSKLHIKRLDWWREAISGYDAPPTSLLESLETDNYSAGETSGIPEWLEDYYSGVEVHFTNKSAHPDHQFYSKVRAQIIGDTYWQAWNQGHWPQEQLKNTPFYLCGGGSRMQFYKQLQDDVQNVPNFRWLKANPRHLVLPDNLEAKGLLKEDYDRLSVAYGLSFQQIGDVNKALPGDKIKPNINRKWRDIYDDYNEK